MRWLQCAMPLGLWVAGACAAAEPAPSTALSVAPLTVCMAADNGPLSWLQDGQPQGLDVRIAQALAGTLGRELRLVPFESAYEKESSLAQEVNALLSSGVCELASGFPLLAADLGAPARPSARTPDHPGAKRKRDRPFVPLGAMGASRAYQGTALGLVLRDPDWAVRSLADVAAQAQRRVGVVSGTLAGTLLAGWHQGALRPQMVSLGQREDPWAALATGRIDALLLPLPQWDAWRRAHRDDGQPAGLHLAAWRQPLGLNLGFVARDTQADLLRALNGVLASALTTGELATWAEAEGLSWTAPTQPEVSGGFSVAALMSDH